MHWHGKRKAKEGQTMIFLIMILVILAYVALWNFDLHKITYVKSLSQNGGDAAALAAARWQGITLNLIGELNLMQAVALSQGDTSTPAAITGLQARLCYVGPMVGLMAAQQAAKNNGVFTNERFTARMWTNAWNVQNNYSSTGPDGLMLFSPPYANCWSNYAEMIFTVVENGVAAAPENARLYTDYAGDHMLLNPDFYDAIAGEVWCWFLDNAYDLLLNYENYENWPPLPEQVRQNHPMNCEYFGLGLAKREFVLDASQADLMSELSSNIVGSETSTWYCYDSETWGNWGALCPTNGTRFPATGTVRPEFDYAGADAATRVVAEASRLTPDSRVSKITWTAAAKPFGYLNDQDRPNAFGVVLPAFREVRLIPIDASSAPAGGAFDLDWRDHIEGHLQDYLLDGTLVDGCWYCLQLKKWESPTNLDDPSTPGLRSVGIGILSDQEYRDSCHRHGRGPGSRGGGRRRGH